MDGEEVEVAPGLVVAIHTETSVADGPGFDSALVVSDGTTRLLDQNDCRTGDVQALSSHGPIDLHWLQYSGAIWFPMVYDLPADEKQRLCAAKVESQLGRAMRYVETIGARAIVPSAGPPAFLDQSLFHLNVVRGDEPSIFADQRSFVTRLTAAGRRAVLAIPGTAIEVRPDDITVTHPMPDEEVAEIFEDKEAYLRRYQADWRPWLQNIRASWTTTPPTDLLATLKDWWEPLLQMAPTFRRAIGANCLVRIDDLEILVDFPKGEVRPNAGEPHSFRFDVDRGLVETLVADRTVDWSNSLFLSCRWTGWREAGFNPQLSNFFKSLSPERILRAEADALRRRHAPQGSLPEIEVGDYVVQRRCPHRNADLRVFGEVQEGATGDELVCTMHGWRFDCDTGRCLTAQNHALSIRPRRS